MQKIVLIQVFIAIVVSVIVNCSSKSVKVINSTDIGQIKLSVPPEKKSVYYVYPERERKEEHHNSTVVVMHKHDEKHNSNVAIHKHDEKHNSTASSHKVDKNPENHNSTALLHKDEKCYVRVLENNEYVIYNNTREEVENSGKVVHDTLCVDDDDRVLGAGTIASIGG
ncbi:hypothetical protein O3M35_011063 [Rhynocoris fuscipes]|uniref:Uncharacterized protein n=1 Tax=Rhynocoris fuscipes TaxID=488301 RepID=A0AAW1CZF9_9HEMI